MSEFLRNLVEAIIDLIGCPSLGNQLIFRGNIKENGRRTGEDGALDLRVQRGQQIRHVIVQDQVLQGSQSNNEHLAGLIYPSAFCGAQKPSLVLAFGTQGTSYKGASV